MQEEVLYDEKKYTILTNYREGFNPDAVNERYTEYFLPFDYIVGDWSYGKLRLKGFYNEDNKSCREINNYKYLEDYLKKNCAYDCRYFILKKK